MAAESMLADTGPLVALVERNDQWHSWAGDVFSKAHSPLITCEAVITEAWHLLEENPPARVALRNLHLRGLIRVDFSFQEEAPAVYGLLAKYADTPMDFADACLVRMSELHRTIRTWTLDGDFQIYRRNGREPIPLLYRER